MTAEKPERQVSPLQNAVYLLKKAEAKLAAVEQAPSESIAVIGMACRFPGGAENPTAFWQLLCDGVDGIRDVPEDRWDIDRCYDPEPTAPGKMCTRWGGFLDDVYDFDADFFGISPREALRVDPQQRLLLEVAWEALDDAAIPPGEIAQTNTGVYVGVIGSDHLLIQTQNPSDVDIFSGTGASHAILANRLSYVLNLHGPSITLDTACSSSLVAIHLACQSLRRRETHLSLAGGVNLILSPEMTVALSKAHMMAPDGRCKTFDASANGYVRGEGCGVLVLKRLRDAKADGDRILGIIRGTAVNHDGRSNGLSAPSGPAQEMVIRAALADARLDPSAIGYVEAHGTGTPLGDPIEIEAICSVLTRGRDADPPLLVGSVKTNIGHLESAAGVAGIIKVLLMLQSERIPPHLHLKTVNPLLKIETSTFEIPTASRPWPQNSEPRCAGVSAFGFGGTNSHIILEQAAAEESVPNDVERPQHVFTFSARSAEALRDLAGRYAAHLEANRTASLADIAFTANTGRTHFANRAAIVSKSLEDLRGKLCAFHGKIDASGVHCGETEHNPKPRIAFLFTGQGSQYAGMGRALYETHPAFRAALDQCAEHLRGHLDRPLLSLLEPSSGSLLNQTGYTQPVLFALEYALATLWRSWGIEPTAVMGHSAGEFAAACVAGVLGLEDALKLISARARLMQALPSGGSMAAVFASGDEVERALAPYDGKVTIAALNGPRNTVISGDRGAVRQVLSALENRGIQSKPLVTSHAFHSHWMEPMLDQLEQVASGAACSAPQIEMVANLSGQLADRHTYADPRYWSRHARNPVRFAQGMQTLVARGCEIFLEIGPRPILVGMGQRCLEDSHYRWLPSLQQGRDEWRTLLSSLAALYTLGATVDWNRFDSGYRRRRTGLPTYPFQRRPFRLAPATPRHPIPSSHGEGHAIHPLLGRPLVAAVSDQIFEAPVSARRPALLADHKIQNHVIMPGAAFPEMALAASSQLHGTPWSIKGLSLEAPLLLGDSPVTVQTVVSSEGPGTASFRIVSANDTDAETAPSFTTHAMGRLEATNGDGEPVIDLNAQRQRYTGEPYDDEWRTRALHVCGVDPGPTFDWMTAHWRNDNEALAQMRPPRESDHAGDYHIHPGLLDSCFQVLCATLPGAGTDVGTWVPMSIERLQWYERPRGPVYCLATLTSITGDVATGDIRLVDPSGRLLLEIEGTRLRRLPRDWMARLVTEPRPDWLYELSWVDQPLDAPATSETAVEPGRWLILQSPDDLGGKLAERLEQQGHRCQIVAVAEPAEQRRVLIQQFLSDGGGPCRGILCLPGVRSECASAAEPDFEAERQVGWGRVLDTLHAITSEGASAPPRLWLITRGAQAVGNQARPMALGQSLVWGLGRVIATEHPELACTRIDLGPQDHPDEILQLAKEICSGEREDQVAYRDGARFVARLRKLRRNSSESLQVPREQPYRLEMTSRGQLDHVTLQPMTRRQPGPGQVEIKVRATGLNFRDVLNVLDLYPGDPGRLGGECAGEIVSVGEGVNDLSPGDEVLALAPSSFASFATTRAEFTVPKPEHLRFDEAAGVPICFATAQYALCHLGKMQPGERLLIHAASGGVGTAAIQIAKQLGLEIFATAGSPRKRDHLRSLGIRHVMDSRSLEFADQVMTATHMEGVDLVLNALTGETIGTSLSVLRAGGRFVELGKTDLWDQPRVDAFKPGVTYHTVALDQMMAEEPQTVGQLMREVASQFADQTLVPPPLRTFPIRDVIAALRHMARAEHIGKVVIQAAEENAVDEPSFSLGARGTYLVTGGLGGLGLEVARWLADRGARHLVLVGRSAPTEKASRVMTALEQRGVHVVAKQCDVSNHQEVAGLVTEIAAERPPLKGVFHLAGVLDDGVLREQTRSRFDRVMAAKALGAWNLHALTHGAPLDLFVLFSSAAALLGSPGQGNYAAANAFLDALAHHRRERGQPALSINWGSWEEVGMAAKLKESEGRRWSSTGIGWINPVRGLETLEQLIAENDTQAGVLPIDWVKFLSRIPSGSEPPWLSDIARGVRETASRAGGGPPALLEKLKNVTPTERFEVVSTHMRQQAARVLAMEDTDLPDSQRPLNELGFDSLTAVEFCNRVGQSIGHPLNPTLLFDYPTLDSLARYVARDVLKLDFGLDQEPPDDAHPEAMDDMRRQALVEVEEMSEEEI
ncbi:MAG: SDR family NAD(P)-dependent oxidoreductase, partial [Pirellulaceae bacterium]